MNVKKMIIGLTLSMLLSSGTTNADWGDVYYCQMTNFLKITVGGTKQRHTLEKFQFKLDQTKTAMVFGSTGYFQDSVLNLESGSQEMWYAGRQHWRAYFVRGKFLSTYAGVDGAHAVSADCDKF
jgi:hypothetical protein